MSNWYFGIPLKIKNHTTALKLISEIESQVDSLLQTDISISFFKLCAFIHSNLGNYEKAFNYLNKFNQIVEKDLKLTNKNRITQYGVIFQSEIQKKENEYIKINHFFYTYTYG